MKTVNLHYQILHLVLLTLKRTEIFGGAYLEWGQAEMLAYFSPKL